jgi:hypothetical protein
MRQEKEEDTTEKRLLPGLFAKKAERSVNFWTSSSASQPIKLILHQNRGRSNIDAIYLLPLAIIINLLLYKLRNALTDNYGTGETC